MVDVILMELEVRDERAVIEKSMAPLLDVLWSTLVNFLNKSVDEQ